MDKFNDLINRPKPTLVDFYADWCQPCHMMAPVLKEVAHEMGDELRIIKVDVDKNQSAALKYGIRSIPTMLVFKKGAVIWRHSGVMDKNALVNAVRQYTN
ncbi:MAG TPA: thioredoxin [Cyclobacteriaceae bacterium]